MLLQYLDLDPIPWNRKALIGTMGNENFSSAALSCLTVFIFYHVVNSLSNVSNLNKLLYCLILAIMTFLVWKTNSLQGLIIICLGIAITTYSRIHSKLSKFKILIIIVVSFVLGLLLFVSFLGKGPFGSALAQYTLNLRLYYSSIGLRAMIENPIFGVGPDSYINGFKLYRDENFVSKYSINLLVDNAHSVPIQIGSGFGITTLIFYLALQLLIFSRSIKTLVDKNVTVEVKAWSLLFILLFLQSLLSIDNIGLGILQWTAGALVISHNQEYDEHKVNKFKNKVTNRKEMFNFPSVTLSILTISILFQGMGNQDQSWKNVFALDFKDGDSQWVKENFNKIGPVIKYESDRVERMLPNLHSADLDSEIRSMLIELVEKNPHDAKAFELLSKSQVVDGKTQGAITSLLAASDLDPMNYKLQLKIAELAKQIGDSKQERESLYKVIFRAPNGSDEYIQASEWLKELG